MLNLNIGLLGHVDSGKTSLAKALSTVSSTASFDKHPQSQERGITIDLGFSSFKTPPPPHLNEYSEIQFTLVDCPGHASLISTVMGKMTVDGLVGVIVGIVQGGAQIIDMMILVVDAVKGVQTQTAECMVIAEITKKKIIVVVNKVDLLKNEEELKKILRKMRLTVDKMSFKGCPIVTACATQGRIEEIINCLKEELFAPNRDATAPFLMAVDHCFGIQGKGTVLTGTILQGTLKVGDEIEIPAIKSIKKVKSIQMFRQNVDKALQGDRVGVCVTQFDPKNLERGLVSRPGFLSKSYAALIDFNKVRFYNNAVNSRARYHISIGHETILATVLLCQSEKPQGKIFEDELRYISSTSEIVDEKLPLLALLEFDRPIICNQEAWVIGSRLDLDRNVSSCRMAFYGQLMHSFTSANYKMDALPKLKIFKEKIRQGVVERVADSQTLIGRNMFKKTTDLSKFIGLAVSLSTGERGFIESSFGQSGKFKIRVPEGLKETTEEITITLKHRRFVYDPQKKPIQG